MSRMLVPVWSAVLVLSPAVRADDAARAIVEEAIKAHGGLDALTKYQAGQAKNKGTIALPGVGDTPFTQQIAYMLPDKFRESLELTVNGQTINVETRVSGDRISITANGNVVPASDSIAATIKDVRHVMNVARLSVLAKEKGFELTAAGEAKVDDSLADGVRVSAKGRKDVTLYFDKKTHLLAKIEFRTTDPMTGTELTEERIIREYQKGEAGLMAPKKIVVKRDGKDYITADVVEFKFLEKLDDSEFTK